MPSPLTFLATLLTLAGLLPAQDISAFWRDTRERGCQSTAQLQTCGDCRKAGDRDGIETAGRRL